MGGVRGIEPVSDRGVGEDVVSFRCQLAAELDVLLSGTWPPLGFYTSIKRQRVFRELISSQCFLAVHPGEDIIPLLLSDHSQRTVQ